MYFLRCLIILCIFHHGVSKFTVPVFLIDYDQVLGNVYLESNPFTRTGSIMFGDTVDEALKQSSVVIIFVEEEFCTEDISGKDESGTPYPNLHEDVMKYRVKYIPNVLNPINVITRIMEPMQTNVFVVKAGQKFYPTTEDLKYFYVFFKDNKRKETRIEALRRHDTIIHEIYESIRKITNGAVVGIYTGKVNPILLTTYYHNIGDRPSIQAGIHVTSPGALFRFTGIQLQRNGVPGPRSDFPDVPLTVSELRSKSQNSSFLDTSVEFYGYKMRFIFRFTPDYWYLDNITLLEGMEQVGSANLQLRVPIDNSYFCDEPLLLINRNDKSSIYIPEYQIKPFNLLQSKTSGSDSGGTTKCNPYFDVYILSGLSVSAICLVVLLSALSFLSGIQILDRYAVYSDKPLYVEDDQ